MVSPTTVEICVQILRQTVPREFSREGFAASESFFEEFEDFKVPLLGFIADKTEEALRSVDGNHSDDFVRGFLDGMVNALILIAKLNLHKTET